MNYCTEVHNGDDSDCSAALDRVYELEAKQSKILDLLRAYSKGEPATAVLSNIRNVVSDLPLVDEPTWAYGH